LATKKPAGSFSALGAYTRMFRPPLVVEATETDVAAPQAHVRSGRDWVGPKLRAWTSGDRGALRVDPLRRPYQQRRPPSWTWSLTRLPWQIHSRSSSSPSVCRVGRVAQPQAEREALADVEDSIRIPCHRFPGRRV